MVRELISRSAQLFKNFLTGHRHYKVMSPEAHVGAIPYFLLHCAAGSR